MLHHMLAEKSTAARPPRQARSKKTG
jgi:hypothetical protein